MKNIASVVNHLWFLVCGIIALLAEFPPDIINQIPEKYRHGVTIATLAAAYFRSHQNLFINPDGSSAKTAWEEKK